MNKLFNLALVLSFIVLSHLSTTNDTPFYNVILLVTITIY